MEEILIYTDGSCYPNPGVGGWAALLIFENQEPRILQGAEREATNNRMELTAPVKALQALESKSSVVVCTDSKYVRDGISSWITKWQNRGWKTMDGEPVKNQDLWMALLDQVQRHQVSWRWVKGHGDDTYNQLVDQLAVEARGEANVPVIDEKCINVFLGVTCQHKTKTGGWCAILVYKNHYKVLGQRMVEVTANILYLQAVIHALEALKMNLPVVIHTSSGYLKDGATSWLSGWRKRGWKTRDGQDVVNREYWHKIDSLQSKYTVEYQLIDKTNSPCLMQEAKEIAREFEQDVPEQ